MTTYSKNAVNITLLFNHFPIGRIYKGDTLIGNWGYGDYAVKVEKKDSSGLWIKIIARMGHSSNLLVIGQSYSSTLSNLRRY